MEIEVYYNISEERYLFYQNNQVVFLGLYDSNIKEKQLWNYNKTALLAKSQSAPEFKKGLFSAIPDLIELVNGVEINVQIVLNYFSFPYTKTVFSYNTREYTLFFHYGYQLSIYDDSNSQVGYIDREPKPFVKSTYKLVLNNDLNAVLFSIVSLSMLSNFTKESLLQGTQQATFTVCFNYKKFNKFWTPH
jgi:hypothetical protein